MYKNILLVIIIAIITGCSAPKPDQAPNWYTTLPKDNNQFYAVGASETVDQAKKNAISSMRENLSEEIKKSLKSKAHKLKSDDEILNKIFAQTTDISNRLSLKNIKIIKSKKFMGEQLVLIAVSRLELFQKLKIISDVEFSRVKQEYETTQNFAPIKRFIILEPLMQSYPKIASLAEYKDFLISTYSADDEFRFLNEMKSEYDELKSDINVYVLTDANSRIFASAIKNALNEKGFSTRNSFEGANSLKLLITSDTKNSEEYAFNKAKSLVKFTTFDIKKNKLGFRQHTFIGKSRKTHLDAKQQSAINLKYKVKKLGIFNFIGIKK